MTISPHRSGQRGELIVPDKVTPNVRELLLTTAVRHFGLHGIEATNLKGIAKEVGVSAPAIYYHFQSKEQLAFEAFEWAMTSFYQFVQGAVNAADPSSRLVEIVKAHVRFKLLHRDVAMAYNMLLGNHDRFKEFSDEHKAALKALERDYYVYLREVIDLGIKVGQFAVDNRSLPTFAIISMCEFVANWYRGNGPIEIDEVADTFAGYALGIVGATADDRARALGAAKRD
jgi:AcrR family transcriptional regulator